MMWLMFPEAVHCCAEHTGRYLLIALLLSTATILSQTAFQLYGVFAKPADDSTLAPCELSGDVKRFPKNRL